LFVLQYFLVYILSFQWRFHLSSNDSWDGENIRQLLLRHSLKYVCSYDVVSPCQNPLKDVDPRVFTRIVTDGRKRYYIPSQLRWRGDNNLSCILLLQLDVLSQKTDIFLCKKNGQGHRVKFLPHNILVNTLESTSFNGFWPNLVHT
jgi:hypothetical protein